MHAWLTAILNLLGMGGGTAAAATGGLVCAAPGLRPRVAAEPGLRPRVTAACGVRPRVAATPGVREC